MSETTIFSAKNIITLNNYRPWASHIAVRDGRILGVGTLSELAAWGDYTLDDRFEDKTLMPGFVEGHGHMLDATMWRSAYAGYFDRQDPEGTWHKGVKSIEDVVAMLKQKEQAMTDPKAPLVAWCFDPIYYGGRRMTRADLDQVSTTRPVLVLHASLHITNVNQAAIDALGWQDERDVVGIKRDEKGAISGELHGAANSYTMVWAMGQTRSPEDDLRKEWNAYSRVATRAGVTTLTDLGTALSDRMCEQLAAFSKEEDAAIRLVPALMATAIPMDEGLKRMEEIKPFFTDTFRPQLVKLVVDGSIQGFTARMKWPGYLNGRENGVWNIDPGELAERLGAYHKAGYHVHIHTNGDQATEAALEALEQVLNDHPRFDHRHTLQHCQMAEEAHFKRMKALGVAVNLFSNHLFYWGDQHVAETMGPDRARRMNATGTASRLGIPFGIHSDTPITPLAPLFTAWCAVNRTTASGKVLGPEECLTVEEALRAITVGAAYTLKMDNEIGTLEAGKWADFAVLEENPYQVDPTELKDIPVAGTVLAGRFFGA